MATGLDMYTLSIIFTLIAGVNNENWSNLLKDYFSNKTNAYQVTILTDHCEKGPSNQIDAIIRKIEQCSIICLENKENVNEEYQFQGKSYQASKHYRGKVIYLLIKESTSNENENQTRSRILKMMNFITYLSKARTREKILLIHFTTKKGISYRKFTADMWKEHFLDLSVIQILKLDSTKISTHNFKHLQLLERKIEIATLHYLNPFTKRYFKRNLSSKTNLFPEKLYNMKGYEMKVAVYKHLGYANLDRNLSGYPENLTGTNVELAKILSGFMNFTMSFIKSEADELGKFDFDKEKTTGYLYQLTHNKIQFVVQQLPIVGPEEWEIAEMSIFPRFTKINALAPIMSRKDNVTLIFRNIIAAGFLILLLLILLWSVARLLKFTAVSWRLMPITQLVLGSSVPDEPIETGERIVFILTSLACIVYLSWIHHQMTYMSVILNNEIEFNTLQETDNAGLKPIICMKSMHSILKKAGDDVILKLVNKSEIIQFEACVELLKKHKNVTCWLPEETAKVLIYKHRDKDNKALMKIVKQDVLIATRMMLLEPGSPFVNRFQDIILLLSAGGIIRKWDSDLDLELASKQLFTYQGDGQSQQNNFQLIFIFLCLYGCSILVFVSEVVAARFGFAQ